MDSQESCPTTEFKSISSSLLTILYGPIVKSIDDNWKNHSFDYTELFGKVMSLLLKILSRFIIAFLQMSKHFFF